MAEPPPIDHKSLLPPPLPQASIDSTFTLTPPELPESARPHRPLEGHGETTWQGPTFGNPATANPATVLIQATELDPEDEPLFDGFTVFTALPSWLLSTMLHLTLVLTTAFFFFPIPERPRPFNLVLGDASEPEEEMLDLDAVEIAPLIQESTIDEPEEEEVELAEDFEELRTDPLEEMLQPLNQVALLDDSMLSTQELVPEFEKNLYGTGRRNQGAKQNPAIGGGLGLRTAQARLQQALRDGATEGSEEAVARALRWLSKQQRKDGGWDLQAGQKVIDDGRARYAATGLALLPFLGAGHTHKDGQYRYVVDRGLKFLRKKMQVSGQGTAGQAKLIDSYGNYYSHGLCTIAICEAYAMTGDKELRIPAQQLINEIIDAQDPSGGGWRYIRRPPGDTSVLGWQLMALKSGKMAYLNVPDSTFIRASRFLDSVQLDYGSSYGYTSPGTRPSTTAVGLLSRMYLGWDRDRQGIEMGVNKIGRHGPDKDEIYFCYYSTQVMHHYGGPKWKKWNVNMRDSLVKSQTRGGGNDGSWQLRTQHNNSRIYCTSMATMILEVYYRHMPIYKPRATDGIPL